MKPFALTEPPDAELTAEPHEGALNGDDLDRLGDPPAAAVPAGKLCGVCHRPLGYGGRVVHAGDCRKEWRRRVQQARRRRRR